MESLQNRPRVTIEPMAEADLEEAVQLIAVAMNRAEAKWARGTMQFYFACKTHGLDSGREYYVWRSQAKIQGLVGLHRYLWGPKANVWLSWFAVHPQHHGKGLGAAMMEAIERRAVEAGYKKLLVETYDHPTFQRARSFYGAKGFCETGRIKDYLPDGSAMIVFGKTIA